MRGIAGRTKQYVEVIAKTDTQGYTLPLWVIWDDGRRFEIDKVLDVRPAASLKCGGMGIRYTVRIGGKATYLYFEDPCWFVEAKLAEMA